MALIWSRIHRESLGSPRVSGASWEDHETHLGEHDLRRRRSATPARPRGDPLSPKAFELLKTLIDQRPRALSKHELHAHLWPATFVSEANLASLIAEVREALGDTARQPRFIRTSHRFGYAFCGEPTGGSVAHSRGGSRSGRADTDRRAYQASRTTRPLVLADQGRRRVPLRAGENILGRDLTTALRWFHRPCRDDTRAL